MDLAEHSGLTTWGDNKSSQMLVLGERGKRKYPDKNLSEQRREPTNSVHIWWQVRLNQIHATLVEDECSQHCGNPTLDKGQNTTVRRWQNWCFKY